MHLLVFNYSPSFVLTRVRLQPRGSREGSPRRSDPPKERSASPANDKSPPPKGYVPFQIPSPQRFASLTKEKSLVPKGYMPCAWTYACSVMCKPQLMCMRTFLSLSIPSLFDAGIRKVPWTSGCLFLIQRAGQNPLLQRCDSAASQFFLCVRA